MEFLALENVDFQTPGSLTERWGSTQYFGNSLTAKVNGLYEFNQTTGASYLYAASGGTLGSAALGVFTPLFSGSTSGGSYFSSFGSSFIDGVSLQSFDLDFDTIQNNAFLSNGVNFFKSTGGSSFVFFGLPRFQSSTFIISVGSSSVAGGFTGTHIYKASWINSYGMFGPATQETRNGYSYDANTQGATNIVVSVGGGSGGFRLVPPNFDITGIAFWRSPAQGSTAAGAGLLSEGQIYSNVYGQTTYLFNLVENLPYNLAGVIGVSAGSVSATFVDSNLQGGDTLLAETAKNTLPWNWYPVTWPPVFGIGLTGPVGFGITLIPRFLEIHDNRLFMAGMSYAPSTFYFSEFGEPEHFEADFAFEVRTNDGAPITGLKEYSGNLMVFKTKSFHQLSTAADDFANWVLTPISTEYGCLTNRAVTTYANMLVFLDAKGVIRYNGSNIEILSTKIDPIFQRMNLSAAQTQAQMTYDKQRNEILCDIPVDGATMNNLTVVYDIIAGAWTTYSGYRPAITTIAQGQLSTKTVFYGGYSGLISYFGSSFTTDNGTAFTTIIKSGFLTDLGNSTQKVFRRLWLDTSPLGASAFIDVHFYQDYGASIIVGTTMPLTPFQNRIDFGVSAKSLSVEFIKNSTFRLALHGFSIAYRFQRNV